MKIEFVVKKIDWWWWEIETGGKGKISDKFHFSVFRKLNKPGVFVAHYDEESRAIGECYSVEEAKELAQAFANNLVWNFLNDVTNITWTEDFCMSIKTG